MATGLLASYGMLLDEWQELVLTDWLAESAGRYASLTCGLSVPRQNGKNGAVEAREVFGMLGRGEKILHTAHEVKTARKHFKRLQFFFGAKVNDPGCRFPELNRMVREVRSVNGQEAIVLDNGGSVEILARSKNSGRGFTADVLVVDEAQEASEADIEALIPTTSAAPLGNPQWIYTGTPPGPRASGEVFTAVRDDALSAEPYRLTWSEWSPDAVELTDIDLDDLDLLHGNNPGMAVGRLQIEVARGERARFTAAGYARERLGWWAPEESRSSAIDYPRWSTLADQSADRGASPVFATASAPDRSWSAIGVAWRRPDGLPHVMLADYRPSAFWVPARLVDLRDRWGGTVAEEPVGRALAQAHNALADAVESRSLRHSRHPDLGAALDVSVRAARWRLSGDTRVLDRKGSADISPLIAAALALHGLSIEPQALAVPRRLR